VARRGGAHRGVRLVSLGTFSSRGRLDVIFRRSLPAWLKRRRGIVRLGPVLNGRCISSGRRSLAGMLGTSGRRSGRRSNGTMRPALGLFLGLVGLEELDQKRCIFAFGIRKRLVQKRVVEAFLALGCRWRSCHIAVFDHLAERFQRVRSVTDDGSRSQRQVSRQWRSSCGNAMACVKSRRDREGCPVRWSRPRLWLVRPPSR
jgi:hypothetical protein